MKPSVKPAAKSSAGATRAAGSAASESDPMLMGTYVEQDEPTAKQTAKATNQELDDFEARLQQGGAVRHRVVTHPSTAAGASHVKPAQGKQPSPAPKGTATAASNNKKLSAPATAEGEVDAAEERRQDIDEVRRLDDGNSSEDD